MRIHKFLATAGVCSRREAERLVAEGVVSVNGKPAVTGQPVDPAVDVVRCRGQLIKPLARTVVLMMNKPRGFLCTNDDSHGGHTVFEMVPPEYKELRLFCVGRLDKDSEGLLLLTNDGDLANKVMHPSGGVIKRYEITLNRDYDPTLTPRLIKGAFEEGEHLRFKKVIRHPDHPAQLEIHLDRGASGRSAGFSKSSVSTSGPFAASRLAAWCCVRCRSGTAARFRVRKSR